MCKICPTMVLVSNSNKNDKNGRNSLGFYLRSCNRNLDGEVLDAGQYMICYSKYSV